MQLRVMIKDYKKKGIEELKNKAVQYNIYKNSVLEYGSSLFFIRKAEMGRELIIVKQSDTFDQFRGEIIKTDGIYTKKANLSHENAAVIRDTFKYTQPKSFGKDETTLGLGDRLGIASPGHIATIRGTNVKPILAQQSIRELQLTNRTYQDVLDDVTWAVFQEGYRGGYGADGDHLKSAGEVKMALETGFTMITLDCSEYINNTINKMTMVEIEKKFKQLPFTKLKELEKYYLNKMFVLNSGEKITFKKDDLMKTVLIYHKMIDFTRGIYQNQIKKSDRAIDFEISIDETSTPTTPQAHYFVATELMRLAVDFVSLAPKFIGEFQKGIDYIGDIKQFEQEFKLHSAIADHFGYKLSIHSGSDKLSIYPVIARYTNGRMHIKTSGTSWLEAMRVIAKYEPDLYRKIHIFALKHFKEATKYYHVTSNLDNIPDISKLRDEQLPELLCQNDARQLIHLTYGLILNDRQQGNYLYKDELYQKWHKYEKEYRIILKRHIGRHLKKLGIKIGLELSD